VARTAGECQRNSLSLAANAFTGMVKTTAAAGKMHSSFGPIASSPAANLMHSKL
jgi:hypothetical protein